MVYVFALLLGMIAGLRTVTAPAAVSWAAWSGVLDLDGTWLQFLGSPATPWVLTLLAFGELINDKLAWTPSRKVPVQFAARVFSGLLSGAAIGAGGGSLLAGAVAGGIGAVIGTFGGAAVRSKLADAFGRDRPAAVVEDLLAVGSAALIVAALQLGGPS